MIRRDLSKPARRCLLAALLLPICSALHGQEKLDFNRDIRPILSDKCYQCHGPDAEARQAELRLDTSEGAFADLGGYAAFRAQDVENSVALQRIVSEDPDERMPPPDSKLLLTAADKQRLRRWVLEGATWGEHWAFTQPVTQLPPEVRDAEWPTNDVDRFVLARLTQKNWRPAPAANRATLIRRVTLDLTGLPPTPEEVEAFLRDEAPDAYEKVVDRLLRSPAYGERMAWEWLDAARYADTDGFQGDPTRTMWPWRDWLIKALNDNMPFDQFTIEMLAGDLLPDATPEQIVATGFNRNHMYNGEGGRIAEETRVENVFDRTETTSTVWLGLTMTCARCHDHKFDPVTQREYYQLFAFFNNTSESGSGGRGKAPPVLNYRSPQQRRELAGLDRRIAEITASLTAAMPEVDRAQGVWENESAERIREAVAAEKTAYGAWWVLGPWPAPGGDGSKAWDRDFGPERGVDLKRAYEDGKLRWRSEVGFVDGKVHQLPETVGATYLFRTIHSPDARTLDVSLGSDDGLKVWLNGEQLLAKNVARAAAADQEKVQLKLKKGANQLLLKIVNTGGIGGFYYQTTGESVKGLPAEIARLLLVEPDKRTPQQQRSLQQYYRRLHSDAWRKLQTELTAVQQQRERRAGAQATVMVMDELPEQQRRKTPILIRGVYNKPGEQEVSSGTPAFLPPLPEGQPRNRLTLARWLVSGNHPLTARVTVNRYWQTFFGVGLVETSEDFGQQGARPSHPELLDWLALRFVESGWDVKALHKSIVTSSTYRQSSQGDYERDPDNQWLSRGSRFRMPSWMLRDQALAASGLLAADVGGPSVKPYQPEGVWAEATFGKIRYQQDQGKNLYRRSLYVFWRRIVGPTMFFDGGKRQTCEVKPTRTNTPLHALTTLNETLFVEAARSMAQRVMQGPAETPEERIKYAFRIAAARRPEADELELLARRWRTLRDDFSKNLERAGQLLAVGESPRDDSLDAAEHAAYAVICSLLLNLDETLTRE